MINYIKWLFLKIYRKFDKTRFVNSGYQIKKSSCLVPRKTLPDNFNDKNISYFLI